MAAQRIVLHHLLGHLGRQRGLDAARHVDGRQLAPLGGRVGRQLVALARQVGLFGVGLRMHRHVFAGGHRHGARHQPRHARDQDGRVAGMGRGHADHQAGGGDDAVVGAQHGGAQPADAVGTVAFCVTASDVHA